MKILGIIPARGGSKGIKNKNIKSLNGKPLISYTIEVAKRSKQITDLVVSTDSNKIAKISKLYGVTVPYLRPKYLSTDQARIIPVLQHMVKFQENLKKCKYDAILLLQPTNPLRTIYDVDGSIKVFKNKKADSVISLIKVEDQHPSRMKIINEKGYVIEPPYAAKQFDQRRQDFEDVYLRNGAIYLFKRDLLILESKIMGNKCLPWIIPRERGFNIDDSLDFFIVEQLLKSNLPELKKITVPN